MKVLIISDIYPHPSTAGAGSFVHRQITEIACQGVDVSVVCPLPRFVRASPRQAGSAIVRSTSVCSVGGISTAYVPFWNAPVGVAAATTARSMWYSLSRYLRNLRSEYDFELIHAYRCFPTGYVGVRLGREFNVPVVVSVRGSDVHTHPRRNSEIARMSADALQAACRVLAVSKDLALQVSKLTRTRAEVRVIYNGVDICGRATPDEKIRLRQRLGLPESGLGICSVCRLKRSKGIDELQAAFEIVAAKFLDVWLAIVGAGPMGRELSDWRAGRNLERRVVLPGARPHAEIFDWLRASDLFVLPSHVEGLPNVVLEAMSCGVPVVATDVGGLPEIAGRSSAIVLTPPRDVQALTVAIERLLLDENLRRRLGWAGSAVVRERFSWTDSAIQHVDAYSEALQVFGKRRAEEIVPDGPERTYGD